MDNQSNNATQPKIKIERSNLGLNMIAGAMAGLVTDFIAFPLDTIKTRI
jgi:hypothetical protein